MNKTAVSAGVTPIRAALWRLELVGPSGTQRFTLLRMGRRTHRLPIACVEGWSISRTWTGVPLPDLLRLAGGGPQDRLFVESFQAAGPFGQVSLSVGQSQTEKSLLALRVDEEDLSLDHGFPTRTIALLMLIWFPLILGGRADAFLGATGHTVDVYLPRWLGITGALFLGSAVLYALAVRRSIRNHDRASTVRGSRIS